MPLNGEYAVGFLLSQKCSLIVRLFIQPAILFCRSRLAFITP